MTTMIDSEVACSDAAPRRRRWWLWLLIGVVVLALIGTGIGWLIYINTYQPLAGGGASGYPDPTVRTTSDGTRDTRLVIVGPPGTTGVAEYAVRNNGSFPVRLLGLDKSQAAYFVTGLKWSDLSAYNPGDGTALGLVRQAKDFPVTLQPDEAVFLQLAVTKPGCSRGYTEAATGIPVRWSALGVHHVWDFALSSDVDTELPIEACPSKAALAHISNF